MAKIRSRAQARVTLSIGVIFLCSLMAVPAALANQAPVMPRTELSLDQPGVSVNRGSNARVRGHVEVGEIARSTRVESEPLGLPIQERSPVVPTSVNAAPPVDHGTTNATTAPSLVKLGLTTGRASLPNPIVAVGPDHVIRSDDGQMLITNRSGGAATAVSYADLFLLPVGTKSLQGQVYFDPAHGRWLAVEASRNCVPGDGPPDGHGNLDFAISDSANPTGGWTIYYYPFSEDVVWEPRLGSSANKLVLTAQYQHIDPDCLTTGTHAFVATTISWAELLGGDFQETQFVFTAGPVRRLDQLTPAIRRDGRSNTLEMMAQVFNTGSLNYETWLYRITGPGANASIAGVDLAGVVPPVGGPDYVPQGDEGLIFPWWGPTSVIAQDDRLAASLTEACTPPGDSTERTCARIIVLGTSTNTPTRLQDFYISRNGKYVFSPGLAFSETDELIITFQRASQSEGPSSFVVRQSPSDDSNSVSATRSLATPLGLYPVEVAGAEMVGLAPDPLVPDAVWVINQAGSADPEAYSLQVAQARTATGTTYVPITPLRVFDSRARIGTPEADEDFFYDSVPKAIDVAGVGTIPANAAGITGNLTVVLQGSAGYVSMGPTVSATPTSSTINFPQNDVRANNVTLPLNADGDVMAVFKGPGTATGLVLDVTGYFLADDTGATYKPLTSARVLDTRVGTGLSGKFVINAPRSFQVTGVGGVPVGATAVTGNLTVVGQSRAGYVSLTPTQDPDPDTSTINFPLGDTRANGVTVPLAGNGKLAAVYKASGGSTDLIFDVTGFYLDDLSGLRFYPLNPGRIMDTRFNTLTQLFGPFSSSVPRTLVTGGHFGVPGDALAVTGNLTVVGQTKAGYISITKNPDATPPVSTLNFPLGDVRANGVTVPLNATNDMALVYKASSGAKTHLILDLTGYFK